MVVRVRVLVRKTVLDLLTRAVAAVAAASAALRHPQDLHVRSGALHAPREQLHFAEAVVESIQTRRQFADK